MNKNDIELTELIRELIDKNLNTYDDACRQIQKSSGADKEFYIALAKESLTLLGDLIDQLPDREKEIKVYTEKVQ